MDEPPAYSYNENELGFSLSAQHDDSSLRLLPMEDIDLDRSSDLGSVNRSGRAESITRRLYVSKDADKRDDAQKQQVKANLIIIN